MPDRKPGVNIRVDVDDLSKLGRIVNSHITRAGGVPLSPERIEEIEQELVHERIDNPQVSIPVSVDLNGYQRPLVKIAYELACLWLGDRYLDDPTARMFQACLLDKDPPADLGSRYPFRGSIPPWWASEPIFPSWQDEPDSLIGLGLRYGAPGPIGVYVRVFGHFQAMLMVTDGALGYPQFRNQFIGIHAGSGATRASTFEEEVARMCPTSGDA
jgi:hypothetical protein